MSDDATAKANVIINVGKITQRRPLVSAKKPHKCDEHIMPINAQAPKIPFCDVFKFKSQWDTGITKLIAHVSSKTAPKITPLIKIKK